MLKASICYGTSVAPWAKMRPTPGSTRDAAGAGEGWWLDPPAALWAGGTQVPAQPWVLPGRAAPSPLSGCAEAPGGVRGVRATQAQGRGDPGRWRDGKAAGAQGSGQEQRAAAWAGDIALRSDEERGL